MEEDKALIQQERKIGEECTPRSQPKIEERDSIRRQHIGSHRRCHALMFTHINSTSQVAIQKNVIFHYSSSKQRYDTLFRLYKTEKQQTMIHLQ